VTHILNFPAPGLPAAPAAAGSDRARRCLDVAVSATALVALAPLLLPVAIAIRLESPGPAIFRQTRIGAGGRPFTILKFRSMRQDTADRLPLPPSDRQGVCGKWRQDPRVTRIGRFIRRTSIDELPQLINVLRGDMALVGPRPALPKEVEAYPPRARRRLAVTQASPACGKSPAARTSTSTR